jgi:hypothetical protein
MPARKSAMQRVTALCQAIADLHHGDLRKVLELDTLVPLEEFGENDIFKFADDGKSLIHIPIGPRPKSLKHRARTGEQLAHLLEDHLVQVMSFGEVTLPSTQRKPRRNELGGRIFVDRNS